MIKKVIFDLDDTLFDTKVDARKAYSSFFKKYSFDKTADDLFKKLDELNYNDIIKMDELYIFLKDYLGNDFSKEAFSDFIKIYNEEVSLISDDTTEVLKYLNDKYELLVLSNWFYDFQIGKMEKAKILKYFDKIYTLDTFGKKPLVDTFKRVCDPYDFSQCVIVGDSLNSDIIVPDQLGMKVFYLGNSDKYKSISDIKELMDIL